MPTEIKSKRGLQNAYSQCPKELREYFEHLPRLLHGFPMHVCLAYAFARLELGQNMALYCGAVKIYRVNTEMARSAVGTHHMTREGFVSLYRTVLELELPKAAHADLKSAEATRDMVMHGKRVGDEKIRNAIARVLEYSEAINDQLHATYRLKPYGPLRGFSGRAKKLDKRTSRILLKGLGFPVA